MSLFAKKSLGLFLILACMAVFAAPVPLETVQTGGAKIENGVVSRSTRNVAYCVLEFQFREPVAFSTAEALSLEFKGEVADPKAMVIVQMKFGKKLTWAGFPVTGEWQKRKVIFSSARFESAFGGKRPEEGEKITGLKIFCRSPKKEAMTLQLKNISIAPAAKKGDAEGGK